MHRTPLILSAVLVSVAALPAQGAPKPAKELAKLDRLIGHFEGSGTVVMAPGGEEQKWTMTSHCRKILDGHCLQEEMVVDLGPNGPGPIVFRNIYGWDAANQRYVSAGISNMGAPKFETIHFTDDDTMVTTGSGSQDGELFVDRWVTKITKDGSTFHCDRAIGGGPFFTHVEGTSKRVKAAARGVAVNATASFGPVPTEMAPMVKTAGSYTMKGWFLMDPSAPKVEFSGKEDVMSLFGGSILEAWVTGDPIENMGTYRSWSAIGWDPAKNCYVQLYANNMGEIGTSKGYDVDGDFVFMAQHTQAGTPVVGRIIVKCDENGCFSKSNSHTIVGTSKPFHSFEATYSRKQSGGK